MPRQLLSCLTLALLTTLLAPGFAAAADEEGFVPLFDGKTLNGWTKTGGEATYTVDDGCILGQRGPGPNTFLCTRKEYHNFILKLEFKIEAPTNSGIQIRSHKTEKGRVFGYQIEIDPSDRKWAGGLYEEGRRGWLYNLKDQPEKQNAYKRGEWNEYIIKADGPHIETWVNGIKCADYLDAMDLSGFIALQVHSGKSGKIRWRNIRLKDLGKSEWKPLFDGKTLNGWSTRPGGKWEVVDGVIHGTSPKEEKRHGLLASDASYKDFAVRLKFKVNGGNSGFYFRGELNDSNVAIHGFQAEVEPVGETGGLYETGGRAWVVKPDPKLIQKHFKKNDWNEMVVIAKGTRVAVKLNGTQTVELLDDAKGRREGHFALQLHGGMNMDVEFKDIEIIEIK